MKLLIAQETSGCLSDTTVYLLANPEKCQHTREVPAYSVQPVKNRQKSKFFCNAQSPYQTASENYRNKQGTVSLIITDPSTCEIKPNMFSSLLIMEMDYLTERTITGWCNTKFVLIIIFFLT